MSLLPTFLAQCLNLANWRLADWANYERLNVGRIDISFRNLYPALIQHVHIQLACYSSFNRYDCILIQFGNRSAVNPWFRFNFDLPDTNTPQALGFGKSSAGNKPARRRTKSQSPKPMADNFKNSRRVNLCLLMY